VSAEREEEFAMEGRLFCNRFGDGFSSVAVKLNVPDPAKLSRLSFDEEVERDQRFKFSAPSTLGRRRNSADVTGRGSVKSKSL
jgi:hypothetical protein